MKWSIIGLAGAGVLAAVAAAVLVGALRSDVWNRARPVVAPAAEDSFVVATHPLPAGRMLDGTCVTLRKIAHGRGPEDGFADPALVVGRTAIVPIHEGQALIPALLAPLGSGMALASHLPAGKRAVAISVTNYAGLEGVLYPGSRVDVIAAFRTLTGDPPPPPVAVTLLENVSVLGVEHDMVSSTPEAKTTKQAEQEMASGRARRVTLEVDTKQAKALELAQDMGTLSLALRNPDDQTPTDQQPVTLLAAAGMPTASGRVTFASSPTSADPLHMTPAVASGIPAPAPVAQRAPDWEMTIMRGDTIETRNFPQPKNGATAQGD